MTTLVDTPTLEALLDALAASGQSTLPTSMTISQDAGTFRAEGDTATKTWTFWFRGGKATIRFGYLHFDSEGASSSSDVTFSTDRFAQCTPAPSIIEMIAELWGVINPPHK